MILGTFHPQPRASAEVRYMLAQPAATIDASTALSGGPVLNPSMHRARRYSRS